MASTSNWLVLGGLVLLIAITALYFWAGPVDVPSTGGAELPTPELPAATATDDGAATGN